MVSQIKLLQQQQRQLLLRTPSAIRKQQIARKQQISLAQQQRLREAEQSQDVQQIEGLIQKETATLEQLKARNDRLTTDYKQQ